MKGQWFLLTDEGDTITEGTLEECLIITRYEGFSKLEFQWSNKIIVVR